MGARQRLIDGFKGQFEPEGDGFVYWVRRDKKGYLVSAAERERFVATFALRAERVAWVVNGWFLLALFGAISYVLVAICRFDNSWFVLAAFTASVSVLLSVSFYFGAWPDADLRGRQVVSRPVSWCERWRRDLMKRSWGSFVWGLCLPVMYFLGEVAQPTRSTSLHWVFLTAMLSSCLISCANLAAKVYLGFRFERDENRGSVSEQ